MRVTIAIDSFKGSLTTLQAGNAISDGILRAIPDAQIVVCPIADGGEGTVDALVSGTDGQMSSIHTTDPLGRSICANYGISNDKSTAFIEMATAAGITLVSAEERNPMRATTYGVGTMILDALKQGCRHFIIGIGGSATNDGGTGMLSALGFEFLDKEGNNIKPGAEGLDDLYEIRSKNVPAVLKECTFEVACDVKNPLCGENGCSAVYGPQKGATPEMIVKMDAAFLRYAELTKTINPDADHNIQGSGAAGGMGFAFMSYLNAKLLPGIELVMKAVSLEEKILDADVVVTGEGRLDGQSVMGKVPVGVAALAKKHQKRVVAFSGAVTSDARLCNEHGIDAYFPIVRKPCTLEEAMETKNALSNLSDTAEQVFRLIK